MPGRTLTGHAAGVTIPRKVKGSAALLLAVLAIGVVGCGGDDEEAADTTQAAATTQSSVDERCESASSDVTTPLANGIEAEDARLTRVYMVKSADHDSVYFVSTEVDGPGYEEAGDVATFASESRFGGGAIYAVDDLANELSTLRDGRAVAGLSLDDDGVEVSRGCAAG